MLRSYRRRTPDCPSSMESVAEISTFCLYSSIGASMRLPFPSFLSAENKILLAPLKITANPQFFSYFFWTLGVCRICWGCGCRRRTRHSQSIVRTPAHVGRGCRRRRCWRRRRWKHRFSGRSCKPFISCQNSTFLKLILRRISKFYYSSQFIWRFFKISAIFKRIFKLYYLLEFIWRISKFSTIFKKIFKLYYAFQFIWRILAKLILSFRIENERKIAPYLLKSFKGTDTVPKNHDVIAIFEYFGNKTAAGQVLRKKKVETLDFRTRIKFWRKEYRKFTNRS